MAYLRGITQRQLVFNVVEENMHTQAFCQHAQLHSDMAVTDNTQFFATRFK